MVTFKVIYVKANDVSLDDVDFYDKRLDDNPIFSDKRLVDNLIFSINFYNVNSYLCVSLEKWVLLFLNFL